MSAFTDVADSHDKFGLHLNVVFNSVVACQVPPAERPHVSKDGNVVRGQFYEFCFQVGKFPCFYQFGQNAHEDAGNAYLIFQDLATPLGRQGLGLLVNQEDVIVHPVADHKIRADNLGQRIVAFAGAVQGVADSMFNLGMDGVTNQVENVLFGFDVFV